MNIPKKMEMVRLRGRFMFSIRFNSVIVTTIVIAPMLIVLNSLFIMIVIDSFVI